jgi:hypothetical protein
VLYEDQPYEDNYTHKPTFLIGMITNGLPAAPLRQVFLAD